MSLLNFVTSVWRCPFLLYDFATGTSWWQLYACGAITGSVSHFSNGECVSSSPQSRCRRWRNDSNTQYTSISRQFYTKACGCDNAQGNPCSSLFTLDYIIEMHAQHSLLSHDELDLVLMEFISSAMLDSDGIRNGRHQNSAKWSSVTMLFKYHDHNVCKKTFLFLHGIGKDWLKAVKKHYTEEGLQVWQYGNSKHTPQHTMPFAAIRNVVSFLCI